MIKESTTQLYGNDRYEGFAVDIINELAKELGFTYEILIQEDGSYGNQINNTWTGMIGEVLAKVSSFLV